MVRMTPCTPCCDGCVLEAFARGGVSVGDAFVIVSGLEELDPRARARYLESVIGSMDAKVHLFVETPVPATAESEDVDAEDDVQDTGAN